MSIDDKKKGIVYGAEDMRMALREAANALRFTGGDIIYVPAGANMTGFSEQILISDFPRTEFGISAKVQQIILKNKAP